jgi:hypothetical protein
MWLRIHAYFLLTMGSLASLNDLASLYQQPWSRRSAAARAALG